MTDADKNTTVEFIRKLAGDSLRQHHLDAIGVDVVTVDRDKLLVVLKAIRDDSSMKFKYLAWLSAVDYPDDTMRFHVVYELRNIENFKRLRIRVLVSSSDLWIPSVTHIFPTANWHEREMMEMFGIEVRDHPDPRKLLLPDWVEDNPLRKDFPHSGEKLWEFHEKTIRMFNEKQEYEGSLKEPWLERFYE